MNYRLTILLCVGALLASGSAGADSALSVTATFPEQPIAAGDSIAPVAVSGNRIEEGAALYKRRCGACHSLDSNRIGPRHRGLYGRKAGSVPDFHYSKALKNLDVIWTDETLDKWLANPTAVAKGTSMGYRLRDADERSAIIQYLKSLSGAD